MGKVTLAPRPLAEIVKLLLVREKFFYPEALTEERLAGWQTDAEITACLASLTSLRLTEDIMCKVFVIGSRTNFTPWQTEDKLANLLKYTPGVQGVVLQPCESDRPHLLQQQWIVRGYSEIVDWNDWYVSSLVGLPQLVELDLCGNISYDACSIASALQQLTGLTKLKLFDDAWMLGILGHNYDVEEGCRLLEGVGSMIALENFSMHGFCWPFPSEICDRYDADVGVYKMLTDDYRIRQSKGLSRALGTLAGLTRLKELHMYSNVLCTEAASAMASTLTRLTQLTELEMGQTDRDISSMISPESVSAMTFPLLTLTSLTKLCTYQGPCSPASLKTLTTAIGQMTALTWLDVSGYSNSFGPRGATELARALHNVTRLTTLSMALNGMGAGGAAALAPALKRLTEMTRLHLNENGFMDGMEGVGSEDLPLGLQALAPSLAGMANLTWLDLSQNDGTSSIAVDMLAESLSKTLGLKHLYLPDLGQIDPTSLRRRWCQPLRDTLIGMTSLVDVTVGRAKPRDIDWGIQLPDEVTSWIQVLTMKRKKCVPCCMLRLLILGMGCAGKTCLKQALMSKESVSEEIPIDTRTIAIDTHPSWKPDGEDLDFAVWDLAGQPNYQTGHSPFLKERSLSMLVFRPDQALGLKWERTGDTKPTQGEELTNPKLVQALRRTTEFTQKDWDAIDVSHLRFDHFVKSRGSYFKPADQLASAESIFNGWVKPWLELLHVHSPGAHVLLVCTRWFSPPPRHELGAYQAHVRNICELIFKSTRKLVEAFNKGTKDEVKRLTEQAKKLREQLHKMEAERRNSTAVERVQKRRESELITLEKDLKLVCERREKLCNKGEVKQMQVLSSLNADLNCSAHGVHLVESVQSDGDSVRSLREAIASAARGLSFFGQYIPRDWLTLKQEIESVSQDDAKSILFKLSDLKDRLRQSPRLEEWRAEQETEQRAMKDLTECIRFWDQLGYMMFTPDESHIVVNLPKLIDLLRPLVHHKRFVQLEDNHQANTVVEKFDSLSCEVQTEIRKKFEDFEDDYILKDVLLKRLKSWSKMDAHTRSQALKILCEFDLVVDCHDDDRVADPKEFLCVCRLNVSHAPQGEDLDIQDIIQAAKVSVRYMASPIFPPGLFPRLIAAQISARRFGVTNRAKITPTSLYTKIRTDRRMLLRLLQPSETHPRWSIEILCTSLGLLRHSCSRLEETVRRLFPGLSLAETRLHFPYKDKGLYTWNIIGNVVDQRYTFGDLLDQKRILWDTHIDVIKPDNGGDVVENERLRNILGDTLGLTASFFLSHCWTDGNDESKRDAKDFVCTLQDVSRELVWYDEDQLENRMQFIEKAKRIIVFLSRAYLSTERCLLELVWAWKEHRLNHKILIVLPVDDSLSSHSLQQSSTIHHQTIKFVEKLRAKGLFGEYRPENWEPVTHQIWRKIVETESETASRKDYTRKKAKLECRRADCGAWMLEDLGEEDVSEDESLPPSAEVVDLFKKEQVDSCERVCAALGVGTLDDLRWVNNADVLELKITLGLKAVDVRKIISLVNLNQAVRNSCVPDDLARDKRALSPEAQLYDAHRQKYAKLGHDKSPAASKGDKRLDDEVDPELEAKFNEHELGLRCKEICAELGVTCITDLKYVKQEDVDNLKLKPVPKRRLLELICDEETRKRAKLGDENGASASAELHKKPVILGFFAKQRTDPLGVHGEAQKIHDVFKDERSSDFRFEQNPEPTFDTFSEAMLSAIRKNVRLIHIAGHANTGEGISWFKKPKGHSSSQENVTVDAFAKLFQPAVAGSEYGGAVECVFLNVCETEIVGRRLRYYGMPHVICWRTRVDDTTATNFAKVFYSALRENYTKYQLAYKQAALRIPGALDVSSAIDVPCFLSEDGDLIGESPSLHASSSPVITDAPAQHSNPGGLRVNPKRSGYFKVHLNKKCTDSLSSIECLALAHKFASWAPGPVLFSKDAEVKLVPRQVKASHGKKGKVIEHSLDNPVVVKVRLDEAVGAGGKDIEVLCTILRPVNTESSTDRAKRMEESAHSLAACEGNPATAIGYSEFIIEGKLEREYWIARSPLKCSLDQICSVESTHEHDLCVMHIQYKSDLPHASDIERASLRFTTSVVLKAYQDKCRECSECSARRSCSTCRESKFMAEYIKGDTCPLQCVSCDHCSEFKWSHTYGVTCPATGGPKKLGLSAEDVRGILSKCDLQSSNMVEYPLEDCSRRRFAFIVGNDSYTGGVKTLQTCVAGAKHIASAIENRGFHVHTGSVLENLSSRELRREFLAWTKMLPQDAQACIYVAGHGMELKGARYLLPVDFVFGGDQYKIPKNFEQEMDEVSPEPDDGYVIFEQFLKDTCVSLGWMQAHLNVVLRRDGLSMIFWDCCREDNREHDKNAQIVRGEPMADKDVRQKRAYCADEAQRLDRLKELNGGFCQKWAQSMLEVQSRDLFWRKKRSGEPESSEPAFRKENDSLIPGVYAQEALMAQFTPTTWPGMITLFAPMSASLALDGEQGKSPLVDALLSWFQCPNLSKRKVLDPEVTKHVTREVQKASHGVQRPEWHCSGRTEFCFDESP